MSGAARMGSAASGSAAVARTRAIIFDLDGTLIDSEEVKQRILPSLFTDDPTLQQRIDEYNRRERGIPRSVKLGHIAREILGLSLDDAGLADLVDRYHHATFEAVVEARWMAGAEECLQGLPAEIGLHIATNNPQWEVERTLARRGMAHHFSTVSGFPTTKAEAVSSIRQAGDLSATEVVFVGDSRTDLEGAEVGGCRFVGFVPEGRVDPFAGLDVTVISDLRQLEAHL